jgi:hypothetical protein
MTWKDKRITEINKLAKGNSDPETPLGEGSICYLQQQSCYL